jgi:hypothetical protein
MTTAYDVAASNKLAWVTTARWERLHTLKQFYLDTDPNSLWEYLEEDGAARAHRTVCGRLVFIRLPGIFSRMGLPRCAYCCDKVGVPRGFGAPANHRDKPYMSNPAY